MCEPNEKRARTSSERWHPAGIAKHPSRIYKRETDPKIKRHFLPKCLFRAVWIKIEKLLSFHSMIINWVLSFLFFEQKMEVPFLEAVKEVLQDRYTENMENIYKIIIKLILQTLVDGYEKDFDWFFNLCFYHNPQNRKFLCKFLSFCFFTCFLLCFRCLQKWFLRFLFFCSFIFQVKTKTNFSL